MVALLDEGSVATMIVGMTLFITDAISNFAYSSVHVAFLGRIYIIENT